MILGFGSIKKLKGLLDKAKQNKNEAQSDTSNPGHTHDSQSKESKNAGGAQAGVGSRVDSGVAGMAGGLMGQTSLDSSSPPPNELNMLQNPRQDSAEQFGKSVAFGGQQAQQFFDRQYGKPVAPPNSNLNSLDEGPLSMDPMTIAKVVGMASDKKEDKFKTQEFDVNSGIPMKGDYSLGVRGVIEREQNLVADYMENRNKPKKNARMVPDQDYANHPNVIEHNENAARKNP